MTFSTFSQGAPKQLAQCVKAVEQLVNEGLASSVFSRACVVVVGPNWTMSVATHSFTDQFDLASVTKVVTSVLALRKLNIEDSATTLLGRATVSDLLHHSAGLPSWRPYFALVAIHLKISYAQLLDNAELQASTRKYIEADLRNIELSASIPTYSDLGYLALGYELELRTHRSLVKLLEEEVKPFVRTENGDASWGPPLKNGVATGAGRPRSGTALPDFATLLAAGVDPEVEDDWPDDDNAAALRCNSGHAGLWANAHWVATLGREILLSAKGGSRLLPPSLAKRMLVAPQGSTRTAGFDINRGFGAQMGSRLCVGELSGGIQTGFTGCSLCLDPARDVSIALLSNAVVLERPSNRIRLFRPYFHDRLADALDGL